jgi:hypothetical protein
MRKNTIFLSILLAISTNTSALAAPQTCTPKLLIFNCLSRGPITIVSIRGNQTYMASSNSGTLADGAYQVGGAAYRFTSGGLKDKSIVRQQGNFYLVETQAEARAAELATSDGALVCTKQHKSIGH